jgi:nitrogen fixation protein NifU and related proteins
VSGLEDLYREIILDHYRSPRNRGELPSPPAHRTEGFNPLCGDEIVVFVDLEQDDEGEPRIADIKISGQGCSISQSSASMMSAAVKGKTIDEVRALTSTFKGMMSIHEHEIGGDGSESLDGSADDGAPSDITSELPLGDLEALRGVVKFPVRIKCATLSWNTLAQALDEVAAAG